jgi:ribosome biogenesis GTPase
MAISSQEDLGYDIFFESNRNKLKLDKLSIARVTVEHRGAYKVKNLNGEFLAKITGKQMFDATSREDYPAVGDWVAITELNTEQAVIHKVLPRRTIIKRKSNNKNEVQIIATNIDVAFVVQSVDRDYNLNRFERYFAIANDGGISPVIVLNKDVILASTITDEGLNELKKYIIKRKTYCFLGSSGVGKSSLINKLLGKDITKTENISLSNNKGKHTTTNREMYFLESGSIVIDNPGMREVGMTDTNVGIDNLFDEITELATKCKFIDCSHISEPRCNVLLALESGELNAEKYSNYISLKKEAEFYKMTEVERNEKDYQFGKFIKTAKKQLKGRKYMI